MDDNAGVRTIRINSGTIVRFLLFVLLFLFLYLIRDLVLIVLTAVVIASAIEPTTRWFEKHKVPRALAVVSIYVLLALMVALIVYFFIPPLLSDIADVVSRAPEFIHSLQVEVEGGPLEFLAPQGELGEFQDTLTVPELVTALRRFLTGASGGVLSLLSTVFGGLLSFILILVISFYLSVQRGGINNFLRVVTPYKYESYILDLWKRTQVKIGRWLQGQLFLSFLVGLLAYVGLEIIGVPNALLLGLLTAIFEIIPLIGPFLAGIAAVSLALVAGGLPLGILAAVVYVIAQQIESNILTPLVMEKIVGVPALVVIISLVIGGTLAGFLGIILSVPVAAALMEFLHDVDNRKRKLHEQYDKVKPPDDSA